jgi:hypothetical protein
MIAQHLDQFILARNDLFLGPLNVLIDSIEILALA